MRCLLLLVFVVLAAAPASAQDQAIVDSLRSVLVGQTGVERYDTLHRLAIAYVYANQDSARAIESRAMDVALATGEARIIGKSKMMFGNIALIEQDLEEAQRFYEEAIAIQREAGNAKEEGVVLGNLGLVYKARYDYPAALQVRLRSLELAEQGGSASSIAKSLMSVGSIYAELGQDSLALSYHQRSLDAHKALPLDQPDSRGMLVMSYGSVARALTMLERPEEARAVLEESLLYAPEAEADYRVGFAHALLSTVHRQLDRPQESVAEAERAVDIFRTSGNPKNLAGGLIELADAHLANGAPRLAEAAAVEAIGLAGQINNLRYRLSGESSLARALAETGRPAEAYRLQADVTALTDSLNDAHQFDILAAMQARFDVDGAERRAGAEAQRAEIAELRMDRQRLLLVAAGAGLLLVVALAGALWRTARLRRRANAALAETNAEVEQQKAEVEAALDRTERLLAEREVLLREVHHRVKNNLQVVASLVNLQAGTLRDPAATAALRQMRARVEAMALVHRQLYGDDDLRTVDARVYLGELSELLHATCAADGRVRLETDVAEVDLDADTAVPLGLATAELVANAFEHAFADGHGGLVRLTLDAPSPLRCRLIVEDDGAGLPDGLSAPPAESLGLQLAADLAAQLGGRFEMERSGVLGGARFVLDFPAPMAHAGDGHVGDGVAGDGLAEGADLSVPTS
ncbi:MAG: histidine kinase dimerization/phosphoacceptor domain -containing protein [Bacteroidota bacterium]